MNLPKLTVGTEVLVEPYIGVLEKTWTPPTTFKSNARPQWCVIEAIRLEPKFGEDDDGKRTVDYPKGWEYLVTQKAPHHDDWGWVAESELIEKGYGPSPIVAAGVAALLAGPWDVRPDPDADWPCFAVYHTGTNTHICGRIGERETAEAIAALPDGRGALAELLSCCELNLDDLEPETVETVETANHVLARLKGTGS
jgi:hypothetical protein